MRIEDELNNEINSIMKDHPDLAPFAPLYVLGLLTIRRGSVENAKRLISEIERSGYSGLFSPSVFEEFLGSSVSNIKELSHIQFKTLVDKFVSSVSVLIEDARERTRSYSIMETVEFSGSNSPEPRRMLGVLEGINISNLSDGEVAEIAWIHISDTAEAQNLSFQSPEIVERILDLADVRYGMSVYSPIVGNGSILAAIKEKFNYEGLSFWGFVRNSVEAVLAGAHTPDFFGSTHILKGDAFSKGSVFTMGTADLAIAVLPHRERILGRSFDTKTVRFGRQAHFAEVAYLENMLAAVNGNGRVVAGVSDSFLRSHDGIEFRRYLTQNDLVEAVHYVPRNRRVRSSINSAVIVLNKAKTEKGIVVFDGDSERFTKTRTRIAEIVSADFDLRPIRYAHTLRSELSTLLETTSHDVRTLADIVHTHVRGGVATTGVIDNGSYETFPYVTTSDLLAFDTGSDFNPRTIQRRAHPTRSGVLIDHSAILVSTISGRLKPTNFEYDGIPIVIGPNVLALKIRPGFQAKYLLSQLQSKLVEIQVEMISTGNLIERISVQDLLTIRIPIPSKTEQDQLAMELTAVKTEKAKAAEQVEEARGEVKLAEYEVVAAISHNLNQHLGSIIDDVDAFMLFLEGKAEANWIMNFDERMREPREGEDRTKVRTLGSLKERIRQKLEHTASTLKKIEQILQKQSVQLEVTDLVEYFNEEIKRQFDGSGLRLSVEANSNRLMVPLDKLAFTEAIANLINNFKKHGFSNREQPHAVEFSIKKDYLEENGVPYVQILYKNDGKPFPRGFEFDDFVRLGNRAGETKGSGIGGFFVKRVIDLHNGKFNCLVMDREGLERFPVQFEILLPMAAM